MRMSKKITAPRQLKQSASQTRWARLLALSLSVFVIIAASFGLNGTTSRAQQNTANAARNAALIAATNEVLRETSELRQLAILRPVQSSAQSRTEIQHMIVQSLDEGTTPGQMHAAEVTLKKLGLAPADFQMRPLIIRLLTEQVAGYYDPKRQQFHLADWIDVDGQKPVMAHELTHALQDQHFNLRRFEHWPKGDSDAELAAHALIEGDATLAMTMYVTSNPLRALSFLKSLSTTEVATEELNKAPRAVRETLLFPYQEGLKWTNTVYQYGGWANVSKAFTQLPQSTEQILHAEKYFVHEPPMKVNLPNISSLLGRGGWRRLDSDVNGEWGFYLVLDQFLKSPSESRRAAAGWGGDHYEIFENRRGQVCYVSISSWDTERDAREFFDAYVARSRLRYPAGSVSSAHDSWSARTSEGNVLIELRDKTVVAIEGLPASASIKAIAAKAFGSQ
jgi:hypothetical protein